MNIKTGNGINVYLNPNSYTTFVNENAMNSVVEGTYINGTMYLGGSVSQNNLPSEDNSVSGNSVSEKVHKMCL
ncbi:MAG: hypothetical protein IJN92_04550 [Lachnospiraceae bacterium]|nr:hypothetical protein [Lachnospiraceae bacterium]